jgi:zinc transporter 1/2/3
MAGLIAMVSCLIVVSIEMIFAMRGAGHMHGGEYGALPDANGNTHKGGKSNGHVESSNQYTRNLQPYPQSTRNAGLSADHDESAVALIPQTSPSIQHDRSFDDDGLDLDELDPQTTMTENPSGLHTNEPTQQKALLQVFLLEAGILFHSIFIGLALSVSTGPPFIVLLIAISFHQTFEGLALGSRIAAIKSLAPTSPKPWLMALAYGTTTPFGQAIGLGVHGLYDPKSAGGLIVVGIMNAVSSGLLLFAGLVELLAEDFLSEGSYVTLKGKRRLQACGAVAGGAALMALVGAWA